MAFGLLSDNARQAFLKQTTRGKGDGCLAYMRLRGRAYEQPYIQKIRRDSLHKCFNFKNLNPKIRPTISMILVMMIFSNKALAWPQIPENGFADGKNDLAHGKNALGTGKMA